jgi:hypothetical protein
MAIPKHNFADEFSVEFDGKTYKGRYHVQVKQRWLTVTMPPYGSKGARVSEIPSGELELSIKSLLAHEILGEAKRRTSSTAVIAAGRMQALGLRHLPQRVGPRPVPRVLIRR